MRRWGQRRGWTLLTGAAWILCVSLASPPRAHAEETERVRELLRVQPGATCLSDERLATQVAAFLQDAPIPDDVTIVVKGSASDPRGVRVHVQRMERTVAYRTFAPGPASCEQLHEVVGLAIAFALKASSLEEEPGQAPAASGTSTDARTWSLALAALGSYRLLPELAPGLELSLHRALGEHFSLRVRALSALAWQVELGQASGAFHATLVAGRADACAQGGLVGPMYGGVCLGVLSGALYAAGVDVPGQRSSTVPLVAAAGAVEVGLELSTHWSLALGLSTTLLLHRVEVGVETADGMHGAARALSRLGFALGLGPVYHFH